MKTQVLYHPLFLLSLALLLLNDFILKAAYPGFLTGKLSDFAGVTLACMFFFVLARAMASLRFSDNHLVLLSIFTVATGFAITKIWNVNALFIFEFLPQPNILNDPTDLVALVTLPIVYYTIRNATSRPDSTTKSGSLTYLILILASFGIIATSFTSKHLFKSTIPIAEFRSQLAASRAVDSLMTFHTNTFDWDKKTSNNEIDLTISIILPDTGSHRGEEYVHFNLSFEYHTDSRLLHLNQSEVALINRDIDSVQAKWWLYEGVIKPLQQIASTSK